ncbi:MAG TPA: hypothetical protein VGQ83_40120 [Polyangia bacterium]|jgi:hypothetical protein
MVGIGLGELIIIGVVLASIAIPIVVMVLVMRPTMRNANRMMAGAGRLMQAQAAAANLRIGGLPAQARVLGLAQTGAVMNYQPQIRADLEVLPLGGAPPFRATVVQFVNAISIPLIQPGAMVPVRIDLMNPMNVALDV